MCNAAHEQLSSAPTEIKIQFKIQSIPRLFVKKKFRHVIFRVNTLLKHTLSLSLRYMCCQVDLLKCRLLLETHEKKYVTYTRSSDVADFTKSVEESSMLYRGRCRSH
jgi:hypothetical protein